MSIFEVEVHYDQDSVAMCLVKAVDELEASDLALSHVQSILDTKVTRLRFPEKVDAIDYDVVLGGD